MSTIEESIQYKTNALKETWVGLVQDLVDRGSLGSLVDALTKISEAISLVVGNLGLLKTAAIGITTVLSIKNIGRGKMYPLKNNCFEYADSYKCSFGYERTLITKCEIHICKINNWDNKREQSTTTV